MRGIENPKANAEKKTETKVTHREFAPIPHAQCWSTAEMLKFPSMDIDAYREVLIGPNELNEKQEIILACRLLEISGRYKGAVVFINIIIIIIIIMIILFNYFFFNA
jgi:hypothetical protein